MWNRSNLLLWVSIKKDSKGTFRLPVPVPLVVVQEIMEPFLEILEIISYFAEKSVNKKFHLTFRQINDVLELFEELLASLTQCEPFDLVNVKTSDVEVIVKIR